MNFLNYRQAGRSGYLTLNRPDKYNTFNAKFSAAYINIGLGGADMSSIYFLP